MRILMVGFDHTMVMRADGTPGDTQERHLKYAEALRRSFPDGRITVIVKTPIASSSQPVTLSEGLSIHPVPCQRWKFVWEASNIFNTSLKQEKFDLITTQSPFDDGWFGIRLKQRFGIPVNVQMRSSFLDIPYWIQERPVIYRVFNMLGKWVSRQADTIRVVCEGEKQRLERLFPDLRHKIFALHPLVNYQTFTSPLQAQERDAVEKTLQQHDMVNRVILLFVGRLVLQKNIPTLLRALASVVQNIPDVCLAIAGDGPLRQELQHLASQLQLERHLIWLSNLNLQDLRGWYAAARGFVFPSFHEGFGKVIVESYLMETPVIASPFVSAAELIRHGETGFIMQSFTDHLELANYVRKLVEDTSLSTTMGQRGKTLMQQYLLSEEAYMQQLIDIWSKTASCAVS